MNTQLTDQRGVAAIEFAIVLPLLLMLLVGMFEFSRAWTVQATLDGAARAAARSYAVSGDTDIATQTAISNGINISLTADNVSFTPTTECIAGQTATATIHYQLEYLTGLFGASISLVGEGKYPCQS